MKRCGKCQRDVEPVRVGTYRVGCGDSTDESAVERLTLGKIADAAITDPPYNVGENYAGEYSGRDAQSDTEYLSFSALWFSVARLFSRLQSITPGFINLAMWFKIEKPRHVAAWTKLNAMTRGSVSRFSCWEPILFYGEKVPRERASDVFDYAAGMHADTGGHPCPKSVKLWVDLVENYTPRGGAVLDLFGGSGTTVVACAQTGRRCFMMELDPRYVDVIRRRATKFLRSAGVELGTGALE